MTPIGWSSDQTRPLTPANNNANNANSVNGANGANSANRSTDSRANKSDTNPSRAAAMESGQTPDQGNPESALFLLSEPRATLDDLVLSAETSSALHTALARIKHHDTLYRVWGMASVHPEGHGTAINLYGPPGTGKTLAAEAIASQLGQRLLQVDYAQIESRFVGDTPKNIAAAFRAATANNAVLFFDEADSLLSRRATNITQAADYGVNISRSTLILELDRFPGVTVFATNLARNYDLAFVRRILAHIYFPLPDLNARASLWTRHIPATMPRADDVTPDHLAAISDGLSGGDILNAVILAASGALGRDGLQVELTDFEGAIGQVQRARQEVGTAHDQSILSTLFRDATDH